MDLTLDEFRVIEQRRSLEDLDRLIAYIGQELGFEPPAPDPAPVVVEQPAPLADSEPAHDEAVAVVQDTVAAAEAAAPESRAQLIADAQADLAGALSTWPDSPELNDLKTKLDGLEAAE